MIPRYKIVVDGQDITNKIDNDERSLLQNMSITDKIGNTSDNCNISLTFDGSFKIPPTRGKIEISIGYEAVVPRNSQIQYGIWKVGTYIVESVNFNSSRDGGKTLTISGTSMPESPESVLQSLQNSHTRFWQSHDLKGTTFEDIVNQVCNEAGLKSDIHEQLKGIKMPFTAQVAQTDAEFLTQISSIRDGKVKYNDDQVIIVLKDKSRLPEITIDGSIRDILDYNWSTSTRNDIRRVDATYKNDDNKIITVSAGKGSPAYIIKELQPDEETANNTARSLLAHTQRSQESVGVSIATQPNIHAESPILLVNFDEPEVNGRYICEEVRHTFNKSTGLYSSIIGKKVAEV